MKNMNTSACACMGKMYGEPYCPCEMKNRGIPISEEHRIANEKFKNFDWSEFLNQFHNNNKYTFSNNESNNETT